MLVATVQVLTRRCADVTHFATEKPTMRWFHSPDGGTMSILLFMLHSGEYRKQRKSDPNQTSSACKNFAMKVVQFLVSVGRENIVDRQKVVCPPKIFRGQKHRRTMWDRVEKVNFLADFGRQNFKGWRCGKSGVNWSKLHVKLQDHRANFRGNRPTSL